MAICGGLVGPSNGNVENVLVFKAFSKGDRCTGGPWIDIDGYLVVCRGEDLAVSRLKK